MHDSGNERRYVMFIPALIALAALLAGSGSTVLPIGTAGAPLRLGCSRRRCSLLLGYRGHRQRCVRPLFSTRSGAGQFGSPVPVLAAALVASR